MDRRTTDAIEIVMDSFRETKKFQNEGFVGYRIDKKIYGETQDICLVLYDVNKYSFVLKSDIPKEREDE